MSQRPLLVVVDPGQRNLGMAIYNTVTRVWQMGVEDIQGDVPRDEPLHRIVNPWLARHAAVWAQAGMVVVEKQARIPSVACPVQTSAVTAGLILRELEAMGVPYCEVHPLTTKSALRKWFAPVPKFPGTSRHAQNKAEACWMYYHLAPRIAPVPAREAALARLSKEDDLADAFLLAVYYRHREGDPVLQDHGLSIDPRTGRLSGILLQPSLEGARHRYREWANGAAQGGASSSSA